MNKTNIAWADMVWNPVTGCTPISEGCEHCFAKTMAETRLRGRCGYPGDEPFRLTYHPDKLYEPYAKYKPQNVFVCSMGDLFHKDIQYNEWTGIFDVMNDCLHHNFLVLTKRADIMLERYQQLNCLCDNVWLGVTAENQQRADERIPDLIATGHEKLFVSLEPLLGSIDITPYLDKLKWVIVGAESGTGRRPIDVHWVFDIIRPCVINNIPVFYKQGLDDFGEWCKEPVLGDTHWLQFPDALKHNIESKMGKGTK